VRDNGYNPNPVNNLFRDAVNGRLSRRQVIQRGSALGLSSALMGIILRAESIGAQATPSADQPLGWSLPDAATLQEELQLNTDIAGTQMNIVLGADGPGAPMDQLLVDTFNEITGAEAVYVKGAESATDRLTFYLQTMAAQSPDIDSAMIDVIWPGIMAAHAVDLSDTIGDYDYFPRIIENNTVDDALIGIPWFTDAGVFYYRQDLLEKYGFEAEPQTWDELEEQAQTIMEGEIGANPAFTGFVWQGNAYEGLTCNGLEWQFSQDGGRIIEPDGTVTINNPEAIASFERAAGWVGGISPEAVTGYMEQDARGVFQGGNAAFMRNWPGDYATMSDPGTAVAGLFGVGQLPAGAGGTRAATLGGWQMWVSAYSENQDAAKEWARFATSLPIQKTRAIERANSPTISSLYSDPDVLAAQPYYENLGVVLQEGSIARPSTPSADLYNDVSIAYFTALNEILLGGDAASLVEDLQAELEDIMSEL
jgi:trehalose/maltose transport system substrate-binding protein